MESTLPRFPVATGLTIVILNKLTRQPHRTLRDESLPLRPTNLLPTSFNLDRPGKRLLRSDRKCNLDVESCEYCRSKLIWCREPIKTPRLFDTVTFDESIHKLLINQPASTSEATKQRASACLLTISWLSVDVGTNPSSSNARRNSYYVDTRGLFEHCKPLMPLAQLDSILDCDIYIEQAVVKVKGTAEESHVDIIQLLANPAKNTITYTNSHTSYIQSLACGILRQLYHKAVALWETIFDHLRSWALGHRNKAGFPRQKEAVAVSLAKVCNSIETYGHVREEGSDESCTTCQLASDHRSLVSGLEYLGRGVDMKRFNAARQQASTNTAILSISTVDADKSPTRPSGNSVAESTFLGVFSHKPHPGSPLQSHGAKQEFKSLVPPRSRQPFQYPSAGPPTDYSTPFATPADLGTFDLSFGEGTPDPFNEQTMKIQANILEMQADLLLQQKLLNEKQQDALQQEQKVQYMQEQIYKQQILLGPAQPPAHLGNQNIFDEMPVYIVGENQNTGSPGDMTLVEHDLDSNPESSSPVAESKQPVSGSSDMALFDEYPYLNDFSMEDSTPHHSISNEPSTRTADKKRKRLSFVPAAKKVRTSEHALPHGLQTDSSNPSVSRLDVSRPIKSIGYPTASRTPPMDDDKPSKTTRPISWPRCRLFRRSAGVSVKKITDVFEKMRLQHDRALPPAS
ncbi:MAG: hypothetical protein Q9168_005754 [Polycauliona sp. 1 TL-2023]